MNPSGNCSATCQDYTAAMNYGCHQNTMCDKNYLDKNKTRCDGIIRDCNFVESAISVCPNVSQSDTDSTSFLILKSI